jgi:hypothetical protein
MWPVFNMTAFAIEILLVKPDTDSCVGNAGYLYVDAAARGHTWSSASLMQEWF